MTSKVLKAVAGMAILSLLLAGARLAAQSTSSQSSSFLENDVRVFPVPKPVFDSGIGFADPHAAAVSVPSAPNAWGGPRTGSEPTLSDRVANYRIEATLDPARHTVTGRQALTWRNRSQEQVRAVYLHLYINAFEGGGSTFFTEEQREGLPLPTGNGEQWGHIDLRTVSQRGATVPWRFIQPDNGPATDHTVVRLDLPHAVGPGDSTTLDIGFITQLPRLYARTGHAGDFHLVGHWFPKIGVLELPGERGAAKARWNVHEFHSESEFYADFGHYDVKLTVPKGFTVGATGKLQAAPVERSGWVTHHYAQGDVHDFAWMADRHAVAPLSATWTGPGSPPVAIKVIYPDGSLDAARRALRYTQETLAYFSRTLGPYPYDNLTVVVPPLHAARADSMEYPTFFTTMANEAIQPGTLEEFYFDFVTIHEAGHGWFQGILASNEFEEPLLDEGLNEFWNHRQLRERGQKFHPLPAWLGALGLFDDKVPAWDTLQFTRWVAPREEPADAPGQNTWDRLQGVGPVYDRSALVLRDLEARIGKEALERGFKTYYQTWKFRHPSVADLREALAQGSGQRAIIEQFFEQQIYRTAKIDDRIERFVSIEQLPRPGSVTAGGKRINEGPDAVDARIDAARERWQREHPQAAPWAGPYSFRTSVTVRRRGAAVPQQLEVRFADGSVERAHFDPAPDALQQWQTYTWTKPAPGVSAEIDAQRKHYADVNKLDDSRTLEPDATASRRWTAGLAAIANVLLTLIATL